MRSKIGEQEATEGARIQAGVRHNPYISSEIQDTRSDTQQITLQFNQEIELGNTDNADPPPVVCIVNLN